MKFKELTEAKDGKLAHGERWRNAKQLVKVSGNVEGGMVNYRVEAGTYKGSFKSMPVDEFKKTFFHVKPEDTKYLKGMY